MWSVSEKGKRVEEFRPHIKINKRFLWVIDSSLGWESPQSYVPALHDCPPIGRLLQSTSRMEVQSASRMEVHTTTSAHTQKMTNMSVITVTRLSMCVSELFLSVSVSSHATLDSRCLSFDLSFCLFNVRLNDGPTFYFFPSHTWTSGRRDGVTVICFTRHPTDGAALICNVHWPSVPAIERVWFVTRSVAPSRRRYRFDLWRSLALLLHAGFGKGWT